PPISGGPTRLAHLAHLAHLPKAPGPSHWQTDGSTREQAKTLFDAIRDLLMWREAAPSVAPAAGSVQLGDLLDDQPGQLLARLQRLDLRAGDDDHLDLLRRQRHRNQEVGGGEVLGDPGDAVRGDQHAEVEPPVLDLR